MIRCSEYDYIELACMYRFPVRLTMQVGTPIEGVALDTVLNESRKECIKLNANKTEILVELDNIAKLEALIENPHFTEVVFT